VLLTNELNVLEILAAHHLHAKRDVIAWTHLMHEPANAVSGVLLMAGHSSPGIRQETSQAWFSYRALKIAMLLHAVSVRDIVRIGANAPGAFGALNGSV
jgi:hypothetical protein